MHELFPWLSLILQRRQRLLVGGLLILFTAISGLGLLALSGWFISATAMTGLLLAAGVPSSLNIYTPGGGIRFFAISRTLGRYAERVYNHDTILRLLADTRVRLFQGLVTAKPDVQTGRTGAQWLTRLTSDLDALDTLYIRLVAPSAVALIISGTVAALAGWLLPPAYAAILAACLLGALLLATLGLFYRTRRLAGARVLSEERIRVTAVAYVEGNAELTAAGTWDFHASQLQNLTGNFSRQQAIVDVRTGWHQAVATLLTNGAAVAALAGGLLMVESGAISGPVSVIFPLLLLGFGEVYGALPEAFGRLGGTIAAAARLNRDCAAPVGAAPAEEPFADANVSPAGACLTLTEVSVHYGESAAALGPLSLALTAGQHLGVIGASGSGKSTLANVLAGLIPPQHGRVTRHVAPGDLAYLTQRTVLFNDTLRNNLVLDGRVLSDQQLWRILALVDLTERVATMPDGLDSWLGAHGHSLSGGEARRVALARTLLTEASVVILDEPFTGVDHATRARISAALAEELATRTLVVLAHDRDALLPTDRLIHLQQARCAV
ncbi:thiol reductant ABC exporter subunit CydC [Marinobacter sp. X15-166B]|uniref:thiol reductant ABC exporter subunit CydC n=1 Tax=Marinobacter sp. X15-166B TaxID=1897620 RepID=UPI00085C6DBB|nr:thiol reductant ABC exporter subunit CydC [Marinobacter sp. X15-166B]OEY67619.1 thiol reductant ABC exporter subunit CydC [Marinobacter sp. X15-166B]